MFRKKGYSLIEVVLVLAIVSALAVSAFFIYNKVSTNLKYQQENQIIATLLDYARTTVPQGSYYGAGSSTPLTAYSQNYFTSMGYKFSDSSGFYITGPISSEITVYPYTNGDRYATGEYLIMVKVKDVNSCYNLVQRYFYDATQIDDYYNSTQSTQFKSPTFFEWKPDIEYTLCNSVVSQNKNGFYMGIYFK